jgi:hypothetical protein
MEITKDQIIQIYIYEDKTHDQSAKILGITKNQLTNLIKKYNIKKKDYPTLIDKKIDKIVERYVSGELMKNICKDMKMTVETVRTHLSQRGIKLRSKEINILGKKFGKLLPIEKISVREYLCVCDCGISKVCKKDRLLDGRNTSCGCSMNKSGDKNGAWTGYKEISGNQWCSLKMGAKNRNLDFEITIEEAWDLYVMQNKKCAITGLDIKMAKFGRNKRVIKLEDFNGPYLASLDRIDSSKGYVTGNVQWIVREINRMKLDIEEDLLFKLCELITQKQKNK